MPDIMERKEPRSVYHNWEATAIIKKKKELFEENLDLCHGE